jgi:hypothetical protein
VAVYPIHIVGNGTTVTAISTVDGSLNLVVDCQSTGLTFKITTTSFTVGRADSHVGGHVQLQANPATAAVIETLTPGVDDRGDFDVAADSGDNLDGQYYGFSSGTGCQFQAAAAIGSPASGVATDSTTAGTHQQTLLGVGRLR